ncbi:MAG: caspase family protein [Planctomycetota bacterium]
MRVRCINHTILFAAVFVVTAMGLPAPVNGTVSKDRLDCLQDSGDQAVAACRRALKTARNDLNLHLRLGDLLLEMERYREAVAVFKNAAALNPKNKTVTHKLDMAKSLQKEREWLEQHKGDKTDKTAGSSERTMTKVYRIRCTRLKGARGLAACDEALKAQPGDPILHNGRGKILLQMGRFDEARNAFMMALRFDPDNEEYLQKLIALGGTAPKSSAVGRKKQSAVPEGALDSTTSTGPVQTKVLKRLALLKSLFDQGLINEVEYNQRKKRLLDAEFQSEQDAKEKRESEVIAAANFGNYYALVIGIQRYQSLTKLQTARRDAAAVAKVLEKHYRFKVKTLFDATRRQILLALGEYRGKLTKDDNLLIYYAGHGWLDEDADAGYWLPVDAARDNDVDWVSLNTVTSAVRATPAKHVMIVADSCYSGKLTRSIHVQRRTSDYLIRIARKRARVVLSSGGLEPVLDSGGQGGHSVFAAAFLKALEENRGIMDGTTLFTRIRRPVMLNAAQTPEYADIREAGHQGGDFVFIRR